jgi:zinc and cadmium transporter
MPTQTYLLLGVYSLLIIASSVFGGWLPTRWRWSHTSMQCILSFVGGFMLGIALLHMLPHGIVECNSQDLALGATLVGLLVTFFLIRLFHFHQHGPEESHGCGHPDHAHDHHAPAPHENKHPQGHHVASHGARAEGSAGPHRLGWMGMAMGLSLHTLFDGVALGSAVMTDSIHHQEFALAGIGVFIAIWLHKWLDALSISSLMLATGWQSRERQLVNLGFALMCPIGALLFVFGLANWDLDQHRILGIALGFSTGVFLCISLGDLLPELQFHRHDRIKLSVALLAGVALAYAIGWLEPANAHSLHQHS